MLGSSCVRMPCSRVQTCTARLAAAFIHTKTTKADQQRLFGRQAQRGGTANVTQNGARRAGTDLVLSSPCECTVHCRLRKKHDIARLRDWLVNMLLQVYPRRHVFRDGKVEFVAAPNNAESAVALVVWREDDGHGDERVEDGALAADVLCAQRRARWDGNRVYLEKGHAGEPALRAQGGGGTCAGGEARCSECYVPCAACYVHATLAPYLQVRVKAAAARQWPPVQRETFRPAPSHALPCFSNRRCWLACGRQATGVAHRRQASPRARPERAQRADTEKKHTHQRKQEPDATHPLFWAIRNGRWSIL